MDVNGPTPQNIKYRNVQADQAAQTMISQFFAEAGSKTGITQKMQPVDGVVPKRINPIRVEEEKESKSRPHVRFADQNIGMNETDCYE